MLFWSFLLHLNTYARVWSFSLSLIWNSSTYCHKVVYSWWLDDSICIPSYSLLIVFTLRIVFLHHPIQWDINLFTILRLCIYDVKPITVVCIMKCLMMFEVLMDNISFLCFDHVFCTPQRLCDAMVALWSFWMQKLLCWLYL